MRMRREEQRAGWSPEPQSLAAQTPSISRCKKKKIWKKSRGAAATSPLANYIFISTCLPLEENDGH